MQKKDTHKIKSYSVFFLNLFLSAILACVSLYCYFLLLNNDVESHSHLEPVFIFLFSLLRCLIIFLCIDLFTSIFLKNYNKNLKFTAFLILALLALIQVLALKITGGTFKLVYLKLIFDEGFLDQAGVSFRYIAYLTVFSLIFMTLFFLVFLFSYKFIKPKTSKIKNTLILIMCLFTSYIFSYRVIKFYSLMSITALDSIPYKITTRTKSAFPPINHKKNKEFLKSFFHNLEESQFKTKDTQDDLPNIIFVMVESLRYDPMVRDLMDAIFKKPGIVANYNYSTSSCTHFAEFSILSGFFPTYFRDCVEETYCKASLFKILKKIGYKNYILNSVGMTWQDQNNYLGLDKHGNIHDPTILDDAYILMGESSIIGDAKEVDKLQDILEKPSDSPNFIAMHFNSSHYDYYYPKKFEKFLPVTELGSDLFSFSNKSKKTNILNRYKNSLLYINDLLQKIMTLVNKNKTRKSIVVVYGDHGEEFGEMGGFAHATALNIHTLKTVMYMSFPKIEKHIEINSTTSHLDVLPTLLDYLSSYHSLNFDINFNNGGMSLLKSIPQDRITFSAFPERLVPDDYSYNFKDKVEKFSRKQDIDKLFLLKSKYNFGK